MRLIAIIATLTVAGSLGAQTLYYGGDHDGRSSLENERNNYRGPWAVFDNFIVGGAGWNVTEVFANVNPNYINAGLDYEIRSGLSVGNGGTLIAGGSGLTGTQSLTGGTVSGRPEYRITISGLNIELTPGEYWLMVRPVTFSCGHGHLWGGVATASGANGVGALNDGRSFLRSNSYNYVATSTVLGSGTWDFSHGLIGSPVPEPATMAVLGLGALALLRRRHRN